MPDALSVKTIVLFAGMVFYGVAGLAIIGHKAWQTPALIAWSDYLALTVTVGSLVSGLYGLYYVLSARRLLKELRKGINKRS